MPNIQNINQKKNEPTPQNMSIGRTYSSNKTHKYIAAWNRSQIPKITAIPIKIISIIKENWVLQLPWVPFSLNHEAWNCKCPRPKLEVLRKPCSTDMVIAAHAIAWEPLCYPCTTFEVSQVLTYKISITLLLNSNMSGQSYLHPLAKIVNFIEIQSNTIRLHSESFGFLFFLHWVTQMLL